MAKQYLKVVALAIGGFMVLSVLSRTMGAASRLPDDITILAISVLWFPVAVAVAFAYFIYRYARGLELDESSSTDSGLLVGGLKLLGVYLFVESVRSFIGATSVGMAISSGKAINPVQIYNAAAIGVLYLTLSYILVKKTTRLSKWLSDDD